MLCRAPSSAKTCAGTTPTGPLLAWDTEGRLTAWQNTSYISGFHTWMEEALYDGEGQRVQQLEESSGTHATTQHTYVGSAGAAKISRASGPTRAARPRRRRPPTMVAGWRRA